MNCSPLPPIPNKITSKNDIRGSVSLKFLRPCPCPLATIGKDSSYLSLIEKANIEESEVAIRTTSADGVDGGVGGGAISIDSKNAWSSFSINQ